MIKPGDPIPDVPIGLWADGAPAVGPTGPIFAGRTVALFGVPGAFTKTCSERHLPGFLDKSEALRAAGVDLIACLSVNDPWVMKAWADSQGVGTRVLMLADGALNFTRACGLEVDLSGKCYGPRCRRFSMLVRDGMVASLHREDGGFGETSAERLLQDL